MQTGFYSRVEREYQRISYRSVLYIIAKNNYSIVVTTKGQKICIYATLSCLEGCLPAKYFARVHRSYIISLRRVEKFSRCLVTVKGQEIPVSKNYYATFTKGLNVICNDFCSNKKSPESDKENQQPLKIAL